jgi:NAD(P)-dependent dehydrogenase (short-subunit alcohol dehydrogenase family)
MTKILEPLPPFPNRLSGKTAFVTGGASGLGAAIATRLDDEGATVIIADIDAENAAQHASTLSNGQHSIRLDVTSEEEWKAAETYLQANFAKIDIVVNNAGITTMGSIEELTKDAFLHELHIDVIGVFLGCQMAIRLMKDSGGGSIINMSSAAGLKASGNLVGYNSAKAAATMMTKSIALHCAQKKYGIRCNSVHPGAIHTPIIDKVLSQVSNPDEVLAGFIAVHPIGYLGTPDDISAIVAYLASDESRFATGAEFIVDGGMTAL